MREDIMTASIRVLRQDGALRFTTPRVAAAAGISVGSLYQYFPNKQALLFALHARTVAAAWEEVKRILDAPTTTPRQKIRRMATLFFHAESEEVAELGSTLQELEAFFADSPDHRAMNERVLRRVTRFVRDAMPEGTARARTRFGAKVLITVLDSVGRSVAAQRLNRRVVERWAITSADMVADFLDLE